MILLDHRGGLSMGTLTKAIAKFKGGVKVPHNKNTAEFESVFMDPPKIVTIPMQQHIGGVCTPTVKKGGRCHSRTGNRGFGSLCLSSDPCLCF